MTPTAIARIAVWNMPGSAKWTDAEIAEAITTVLNAMEAALTIPDPRGTCKLDRTPEYECQDCEEYVPASDYDDEAKACGRCMDRAEARDYDRRMER